MTSVTILTKICQLMSLKFYECQSLFDTDNEKYKSYLYYYIVFVLCRLQFRNKFFFFTIL